MSWGVGEAEPAAVDQPPTRGELELVHENLLAWFRVLATSSDGGRVEEGEGYLCFAGAHEYPGTYTNGVVRTSGALSTTPAELLARADAFFGQLGRPYVTWVRADDTGTDADLDAELRRRGHWARPPETGSEVIWTRLRTRFADHVDLAPAGINITVADTDSDREAFVARVAASYGLADADLALAEALLLSVASLCAQGVHLHVARERASGLVRGGLVTYDAAGGVHVGWTVTDEAVRGRGVASAVARLSLRDATKRGAAYACGVSSQQGVPLWRSLGFHLPTRYKRFVAPAPEPVPAAIVAPRGRRRSAGAPQ